MRLKNIHGFNTIDEYVSYKINKFQEEEKSFETLFHYMFDESENVMAESSDGYRIRKITYGEFKQSILDILPTAYEKLSDLETGSTVGLYMGNSIEWIKIFWAILAAGYRPLLMNTRLSDAVLEDILATYGVSCVISDGKRFSVNTLPAEEINLPSDKTIEPRPFGEEVFFMSSGTTEKVKLCAYTAENFFYQVLDSAQIIKSCPEIKNHFEGELKHLILLPFCHVFGFIAVYLWFGFFQRTFVFPKDLNPDTIQRTVKKHKVTHIFAVPMVWEAVHKAAMGKIKARGEKTLRRFLRVKGLVNRLSPSLGNAVAGRLLSEVREGLFGDSIQFLISGGSHIRPETLAFFNGIGYHLANGYGMTEIGITSVEFSSKKKILNSGTIGRPFSYTEYSIDGEGRLLVRGKARASRILQNGEEAKAHPDEWFCTGDLMRCEDGRYLVDGRCDDLIIGDDGENLNPQIAEGLLACEGVDRVCLYKDKEYGTTLLVSVPGTFSEGALRKISDALLLRTEKAKLERVIKRILFTHEPLLRAGEIKISRKKIAERVSLGEIRVFDPRRIEEHLDALAEGLEAEITACFAEALEKNASEITADANFFRDLGGTSIDYFALIGILRARIGIDIIATEGTRFATVREFSEHIKSSDSKTTANI